MIPTATGFVTEFVGSHRHGGEEILNTTASGRGLDMAFVEKLVKEFAVARASVPCCSSRRRL